LEVFPPERTATVARRCAVESEALLRALASGFVAAGPPEGLEPASAPELLPIPERQLLASPADRVRLGDRIGPWRRCTGRLGVVLARGDQLLGLSAGHVFDHEGQSVFRGDQAIGRVVRLARPRRGLQAIDLAVLELRAFPMFDLTAEGPLLEPGFEDPVCGEEVYLAAPSPGVPGRVSLTSAVAHVEFGADEYWLPGQFVVEGPAFATSGDCGGALLGADGRARGLLIAGRDGCYVATPMRTAIAAFALFDAIPLPLGPQAQSSEASDSPPSARSNVPSGV
jgi:hypothetical protein